MFVHICLYVPIYIYMNIYKSIYIHSHVEKQQLVFLAVILIRFLVLGS